MAVRAASARDEKKEAPAGASSMRAEPGAARAWSDFRQKILRRPIAMPVWLLRPGSSTFAAPFVLLKSTVP
ncbi:hypothetical protein BamMEX5DRAFT_4349 [Burkholderia ambifaria MEX-5]|uniref:Uncharacterized protein n=1 Tax=Burkholderia ambifaria MEX-5 TaxID=396597 RepID=B1T983_9BURK|nr:hypothetical protein BamMEX5DRAFT_4349 [Burkholderia ambifaria MEX-5]